METRSSDKVLLLSLSLSFNTNSFSAVRQVLAMAAASIQCALGAGVISTSPSFRCISSYSPTSCSSSVPTPPRFVSFSSAISSQRGLLSSLLRQAAPASPCCQAASEQVPTTDKVANKSLLCTNCEGNGAVVCSQCKGEGLNVEDHFGGRFKAGTICWLCRGKKQVLCGNCNGAGFMGGFLNTQDD